MIRKLWSMVRGTQWTYGKWCTLQAGKYMVCDQCMIERMPELFEPTQAENGAGE